MTIASNSPAAEKAVIDKIAWLHIVDGRVLMARSKGKDVYYLPGGKPEAGESDSETLARELDEELGIKIAPASIRYFGVFEAEAHGKDADVLVRMTCYSSDFRGTIEAASEIAETAWLGYADRDRVSAVNRLIFDCLHDKGLLND
ncbi:pyrimidine (deoxy)nucleoside triphosphate pyrophosphohydrolase [Hartmannibacter diazotrophicus]|uniref:Pyrimidine (Deoxy)nucleoside triphosphate pyrophosphohydrolase n=1 Tax=Hartmannibacter diazotrophicus TaxID=1482074 RepID=A0A2C9D965_9HYPH|nr:NUDIX domain-containing protein [Hartmannibacter diazotrophicus]SON56837.1 pyrimidine (deoxy)nucleoside triphosphate pyrophosphohydrolase [Hartmannibacter diazotrophicus]